MMPVTYTVKVTKQAQEQMHDIVNYIAYTIQSPKAAIDLLDALETSITSLSEFPNSIALMDEEPWRSQGIHRLPVKNYLVYFWVNELTHTVQITAVVYGKRDQVRQLANMALE